MMMNEIDKQIAQKLAQCGWCEPMHARMSLEDCEKLRNREPNYYADIDGAPPHCASCPGLKMDGQQKEMPMNQQQSYTVRDLSNLSGVHANYIHGLKQKALRGDPLPEGETRKRVLKTLQDLGIDWCDIVRDLPGWTKARLNKTSTCQISQIDNLKAADRNMGEDEAVLPSESAELPNPERKTESGMETAIVVEDAETLKQELRETDNPYPLGLGQLPLELLVGEIVRRFPRAEVVLR